jgi:hypothetical protein
MGSFIGVCVRARARVYEYIHAETRIHMAEDSSANVQELGRKCEPRTECKSAANF